jgi:hypothetical protein
LRIVAARVQSAIVLCSLALVAACGAPEAPRPAPAPPAAPTIEVDANGGTPRRGPGDLYNACERVWCLTHERNFDLSHFLTGHIGWILHDEGHGDVFVPKHRTTGPAFPHARDNVLLLCGQHVHPYWLGGRRGPVTRTGYNVALGYGRAHFNAYGTRLPPCCLNEQGWGFLHASTPREYRFGDRTTVAEMAGAGWQKAFAARSAPPSGSR